jgi:hypothetical protein
MDNITTSSTNIAVIPRLEASGEVVCTQCRKKENSREEEGTDRQGEKRP